MCEPDLSMEWRTSPNGYVPTMGNDSITDLQAVRTILGRAFADDPLMQWIFPDEAHRQELTAAWLGLFAEGYMSGGRVDTITDSRGAVVAVALWKIPSDVEVSMPTLPGPLQFLGAVLDPDRFDVVVGSFVSFVEHWPDKPHAYLALLAVDPDQQGCGLGKQVVRSGIEEAVALGLDVALETNKIGNVDFYRSLGFEITGEYVMGPDGPRGWSLRLPAGN